MEIHILLKVFQRIDSKLIDSFNELNLLSNFVSLKFLLTFDLLMTQAAEGHREMKNTLMRQLEEVKDELQLVRQTEVS